MERMPAPEFIQWQILESIEPFGDARADIHVALIRQTIANMSGKQLRRDMEAADFLPNWIGTKAVQQNVQTPQEMHANFVRIFEFAKKKAAKEQAN